MFDGDPITKKFDPNQRRDEDGRWTEIGGSHHGDAVSVLKASVVAPRSPEEAKALGSYQGARHIAMNGLLRGITPDGLPLKMKPEVEADVREDTKNLTALIGAQRPLKTDAHVFRGLNPRWMDPATVSALKTPGTEVEEPAFMSTTATEQTAAGFATTDGLMFDVTIPAGARALWMGNHDDEVVLKPGSRLRVVSARDDVVGAARTPITRIHVELID